MKSVALPYRLKELERVARQLKLDYTQFDEHDTKGFIEDFQLYKRRGRIEGVVRKEVFGAYSVCIFDYYYGRPSPNDAMTTAFFIHCKELALPEFLMEPERFFHQVAEIMGRKDFDFEAYPVFSEQYYLGGKEEEQIREVFRHKLLRRFSLEQDYTLEGINYYLLFYRLEKLLDYKQMIRFYRAGMSVYKELKKRSAQL
ncbi:MAG: hypothetical protein AAFO94_04560 [Bacteroidota bacterium]